MDGKGEFERDEASQNLTGRHCSQSTRRPHHAVGAGQLCSSTKASKISFAGR